MSNSQGAGGGFFTGFEYMVETLDAGGRDP
jgi:hypothetical protein